MKKFVFDIGNVLAVFDGKKFVEQYVKDQNLVNKVYDLLFPGIWNQYDQGILSEKEIVDLAVREIPECAAEIEKMMKEWTDLLQVNRKNLDFVSAMEEDCYILSNLPEKAEIELQRQGLFEPFQGALCSWREKLLKPDPEIYRTFLRQNSLQAKDCVFIDDRKENVEAACALGMQGMVLESIDQLENCIKELRKKSEITEKTVDSPLWGRRILKMLKHKR